MKNIFTFLLLLLPLLAFSQSKEADSLYNEGMKLYYAKRASEAVPILQKADSLEKAQLDPKSPNYYRSEIGLAKCWSDLAAYYADINDTTEALRLQSLVVSTTEKTLGKNHLDYYSATQDLMKYHFKFNKDITADEYYDQGRQYLRDNHYHEAITYLQKCDSLDKMQKDKKSSDYHRAEILLVNCWTAIRDSLTAAENYDEAIEYQRRIVATRKSINGQKTSYYTKAQEKLAELNLHLGKCPEADPYYNRGMELYNAKQTYDAIPYFEKSDAIEKSKSPQYHRSELAINACRRDLVNHYVDNNDYAEAARLQTLVVNSLQNMKGKKHWETVDAKNKLIRYRLMLSDAPEADQYYNEGYRLYKDWQAHLAIPYLEKSDSIEKAKSPNIHRSECILIKCWNDLAEYYAGINDPEALRLQTLAVNTSKKIYGELHPDYINARNKLDDYQLQLAGADSLYNTGINLYKTRQAYLAVPYLQQSDSIEKALLTKQSPKYNRSYLALIDCWKNLVDYYADINDTSETIRLQTLVVNGCKTVYGKKSQDYTKAQKNLDYYRLMYANKLGADDYYNHAKECLKMYNGLPSALEACKNFTRADSIEKATLKPDSPNYYRSELELIHWLAKVSSLYYNEKNYGERIRYEKLALEHIKNVYGEEHELYLDGLKKLIYAYDYPIEDYTEIIKLKTRMVEIRKKMYGEEHPTYLDEMSDLAYYYFRIGNYNEAIKFVTRVTEIYKKLYGEDNPQYGRQLERLAYWNLCIGNHTEAIRLASIYVQILKKVYGEESEDYAAALIEFAAFYEEIGNNAEAIQLYTKAAVILKNTLENSFEYDISYEISLSQLAKAYANTGNYTEAIKHQKLLTDLFNFRSADNYIALANYYLCDRQYDKVLDLYKRGYEINKSKLSANLRFLTNKERNAMWNSKYSDFYSKDLLIAAYKYPIADATKKNLTTYAYNGQVLSKGFMLNSELEIESIIKQKGNSVLAERYNKMKQDRATLDLLINTPLENRTMDADSLAKAIDDEEHQLVAMSKELGSYVQNLSIDWKEIQKNLRDGDLAIEFANFKDTAAKQLVYVALVLKKDMTAPEIVKLYESDEFYDIKPREYYNTPKLYNIIWRPLAKYLEGVKTVYFSPVGQIHTIGIEYLSGDDGKIFAEKFDTYRLSSTRELAMTRAINPNRKASTYGGIQYEFSKDEWQELKGNDDNYAPSIYRDIPQIAANLRGLGMGYLEGTKLESASIAALLRSADYDVTALSDAAATEESFKMLSGTGLKILHIGTHGFYETAADMENAGYKFFSENQQSEEDRSLSCSGLLFAGANSALDPKRNAEIPEGADDGVLTAKEISRLDFQGLDLVVLSACQTGLGEITGEGVFGLQRGFKKAGAQTIVMSLWKVADESTQLLMVEFFKNLTAGQSKRAAFLAAQKTVREKYPNPLHWAAFVMVDGL